jgi:hypothetical protein
MWNNDIKLRFLIRSESLLSVVVLKLLAIVMLPVVMLGVVKLTAIMFHLLAKLFGKL